jgi:hypothetical protein
MPGNITSVSLRSYWVSKYEDKFDEEYPNNDRIIELQLLKRLMTELGYHVVLEAIDQFMFGVKKEQASIKLFASRKYFTRRFKDLIAEKDIVKYQRLLPWYNENNQTKINLLLQRYKNYVYALSLTHDDLQDMKLIVDELKTIPIEN